MKKKLYALCVGINDYQYVGKLAGCVPDATNMAAYLERAVESTGFELEIKLLTDASATKSNIVNTFLEHLGNAKSEDVALFYFSGHGAEEKADEIFAKAGAQDEFLTTMVCYDSRNGKIADLADKELRYLIAKVAANNPHFVLITDSCHSGGATRHADTSSEEMTPRLTEKVGGRAWEQFIFHREFPYSTVKNKSIREWLPEGKHIHLSSCDDDELAYEVRGSGVFTASLLEILERSSGKVSYRDLSNRIKHFVKGRYPQTPQVYQKTGDKTALREFFLGGAARSAGVRCNLVFNQRDRNWVMDMGAIHGLPPLNADKPLVINILDDNGEKIAAAKLVQILPGTSIVELDKTLAPRDYTASIEGLYRTPIKVAVRAASLADQAGASSVEQLLGSKVPSGEGTYGDQLRSENVEFTDNELNANYTILVKAGVYSIVRPFSDKPLVQQFPLDGRAAYINANAERVRREAIEQTLGNLAHIAKWEFTRNLANPTSQLKPKPPVLIEVLDADESPMPALDNEWTVAEGTDFYIKFTNRSDRPLYISAIYMSQMFGATTNALIPDATVLLKPSETYFAAEKELLTASLSYDATTAYNWESEVVEIKIIASTSAFDVDFLELQELPQPDSGENFRGFAKKVKLPQSEDWITHSFYIKTPNSNYNIK